MIEMLDKSEYIAFCIAERVEPSARLMGDDDDLAPSAKLDRPPGTLLHIDREARLLENGSTAHLVAQRLYFLSVHAFSSLPSLPVILRAGFLPAAKSKGGKGACDNCRIMQYPAAAKPPLRPAARKRHAEGSTPAQ